RVFLNILLPSTDTLRLEVSLSDAVQQLKQRIEDETQIPVSDQKLFFGNLELENGRTLDDYNIINESTISVKLRITPSSSNILYVDKNVNSTISGYLGTGSSWENALTELADALKWAREQYNSNTTIWTSTNPLQIFVAKGTYLPKYHADDNSFLADGGIHNSFVLVPNVQLYGGFDPLAEIRDLDDERIFGSLDSLQNGTILSGDFNQNDLFNSQANHSENALHVTIVAGDLENAKLDGF